MSTSLKQPDHLLASNALAAGDSAKNVAYDEPGCVLVDRSRLPPTGGESEALWAWVAVDLATGWVHAEALTGRTHETARGFLTNLKGHARFKIRVVITDRSFSSDVERAGDAQTFGQICAELGFEHRATPTAPKVAAMTEWFLSTVNQEWERINVTSREAFEMVLRSCVARHNAAMRPTSVTPHESPIQSLKRWYASRPELFVSDPANQAGQPG